jgi:hypothetical protein
MSEKCKFCERDVDKVNEFGACPDCESLLNSPQLLEVEGQMMTDYERFRAQLEVEKWPFLPSPS